MTAKIAAALVAAQKSLKGVHKTSTNQHHRYDYASSESIFRECRDALFDHGLVVVPKASRTRHEESGVWLVREYVIVHEDGETLDAEQVWPVVPGNGRPLDKAIASAATASLAYFLRDLLLLPRVEKGVDLDDDERDERPAPPAGQQRSQGERGASARRGAGRSPLTIDQRITGALDSLEIKGDVSRWHAVTRAAGVPPDVDGLTEAQKKEALSGLIEQYRARQAQNGEVTA